MPKAHVISHTHWDREWFLPSNIMQRFLPSFFDALFDLLEKEKDYVFVLDGQTLIIEDYLRELERIGGDIPKAKQRLQYFAQKKKLILGPYYLQPDWQLASGEALIRNFLIGKGDAKEYGESQKSGWLLDNFGQIAQTAQLHKKSGLKGLFVWRGIDLSPSEFSSEFIWQSPDGSNIFSIYLLDSYRNAMRLTMHDMGIKRAEYIAHRILPFAHSDNVLLMNGYDQEIIPENIQHLVKQSKGNDIEIHQSTPENYLDTVMKEIEPDKLPKLYGSQYCGRYISVFPGVMSARIQLKQQNWHASRLLERFIEPLQALAFSQNKPINMDLQKRLWRDVLQNLPHDSICGVSVDSVHHRMEKRSHHILTKGKELAEQAFNHSLIKYDDHGYTTAIYSPAAQASQIVLELQIPKSGYIPTGSHVVSFEVLDDQTMLVHLNNLAPLSISALHWMPADEPKQIQNPLTYGENYHIGNSWFDLNIHDNGHICLTDKQSGMIYDQLLQFEDMADAGDTYNYSRCLDDETITSGSQKAKIAWVQKNKLRSIIKIETCLNIPVALDQDRKARSAQRMDMHIITYVTIDAASPMIRCRTELNNQYFDHRLRLCFPTLFKACGSQTYSQFNVEHHDEQMEYKEKIPKNVAKLILGARETQPTSQFNNMGFISINDKKQGLAVFTRGLHEYQVQDGCLALSLFRSVGWIAREDLLSRDGDAGPMIATPAAQLIRPLSFEYGLMAHQGDAEDALLNHHEENFNNLPLSALLQGQYDKHNLVTLMGDKSVTLTALKCAEDEKFIIVRICNLGSQTQSIKLKIHKTIISAYHANLVEDINKELPCHNNEIHFDISPKAIETFAIKLQESHCPQAIQNAHISWRGEFKNPCLFQAKPGYDVNQALLDFEDHRIFQLYQRKETIKEQHFTDETWSSVDAERQYYSDDRAYHEACISKDYIQNRMACGDVETQKLNDHLYESRAKPLTYARVYKRALEYIAEYMQKNDQ